MRTLLLHILYITVNLLAGAAMWRHREQLKEARTKVIARIKEFVR